MNYVATDIFIDKYIIFYLNSPFYNKYLTICGTCCVKEKLRRFILACQDEETGGFADRPGDMVSYIIKNNVIFFCCNAEYRNMVASMDCPV